MLLQKPFIIFGQALSWSHEVKSRLGQVKPAVSRKTGILLTGIQRVVTTMNEPGGPRWVIRTKAFSPTVCPQQGRRLGLSAGARHPPSAEGLPLVSSSGSQWIVSGLKPGEIEIQAGSVPNLLCNPKQASWYALELSFLKLIVAPHACHFWVTIYPSSFISPPGADPTTRQPHRASLLSFNFLFFLWPLPKLIPGFPQNTLSFPLCLTNSYTSFKLEFK